MRIKVFLCGCVIGFLIGSMYYSQRLVNSLFKRPRIVPNSTRRRHTVEQLELTKEVLIDQPSLCYRKNSKVVIVIMSANENFEQRQQLRKTWIREAVRLSVPYAFVLAHSVNHTVQSRIFAEHDRYGDIIAGQFIDSWYNLTLKTTFAIGWMLSKCGERWLLKTDDSSIVNVPNLIEMVNAYSRLFSHIYGQLKDRPVIDHSGTTIRRYVTADIDMPGRHWPRHVPGVGYLISPSALKPLYQAIMPPDVAPKM